MISKILRILMAEKGWNQRELAKRSGVKQTSISAIICERSKSPKIDTLQKIAHAFGEDLSIFEQPGEKVNPEKTETDEEIHALLRGIPSERDKQTIAKIIKAFRERVDAEEAASAEGKSKGE